MQRDTLALCVVDYQERLMPAIHNNEHVLSKAIQTLRAIQVFNIPVFVTEQYPKGLGHTVSELSVYFEPDTPIFEKTRFSAYTKEVRKHLHDINVSEIILIGVETHVCVYQTVRDLIQNGYQVSVVVDAISSRSSEDRSFGLRRIEALGAKLVTSEMLIYEIMDDAKTPEFKEILKIVQ